MNNKIKKNPNYPGAMMILLGGLLLIGIGWGFGANLAKVSMTQKFCMENGYPVVHLGPTYGTCAKISEVHVKGINTNDGAIFSLYTREFRCDIFSCEFSVPAGMYWQDSYKNFEGEDKS